MRSSYSNFSLLAISSSFFMCFFRFSSLLSRPPIKSCTLWLGVSACLYIPSDVPQILDLGRIYFSQFNFQLPALSIAFKTTFFHDSSPQRYVSYFIPVLICAFEMLSAYNVFPLQNYFEVQSWQDLRASAWKFIYIYLFNMGSFFASAL